MNFRDSLAGRLLGAELLAICLLLTLAPFATSTLLRHTVDTYQREQLVRQAAQLQACLSDDDGTIRLRLPVALQAVFAAGFDSRAYALMDNSGRILLHSPGSTAIPLARIPRGTVDRLFHAGHYVGLSRPLKLAGHPAWIVVSQDETAAGAVVDDIARALLPRTVGLIVIILALLPVLNAVILRDLGRRVREVALSAETIGPDNPGLRLAETRLPREVASLARATNRLVARLEKSIGEHRGFIANVTHELKTPLATLSMQIDGIALPERLALSRSIEHVSRVISQLRTLAEFETFAEASWTDFDACSVVQRLVEVMAPQIYASGHTIELRTPDHPVRVLGEQVLVDLAIHNLLDNARKHTPSGTEIIIEVGAEGRISVSDNGSGVAIHDLNELRARFRRADQNRTDSAGLGLSIVDRICEVHGTTLNIGTSRRGGACFSFRLPSGGAEPQSP